MSNPLAEFFYEQCAGATSGHMAMIPNNPIMFSLIAVFTGGVNNTRHAATKEEFQEFLRYMADELDADA